MAQLCLNILRILVQTLRSQSVSHLQEVILIQTSRLWEAMFSWGHVQDYMTLYINYLQHCNVQLRDVMCVHVFIFKSRLRVVDFCLYNRNVTSMTSRILVDSHTTPLSRYMPCRSGISSGNCTTARHAGRKRSSVCKTVDQQTYRSDHTGSLQSAFCVEDMNLETCIVTVNKHMNT